MYMPPQILYCLTVTHFCCLVNRINNSLRCLSVGYCDDTIYTAIQRYGYIGDSCCLLSVDTNEYCLDDDHEIGIKILEVYRLNSPSSLLSMLREYHNTLKSLTLHF